MPVWVVIRQVCAPSATGVNKHHCCGISWLTFLDGMKFLYLMSMCSNLHHPALSTMINGGCVPRPYRNARTFHVMPYLTRFLQCDMCMLSVAQHSVCWVLVAVVAGACTVYL